MAAAMTDEGEVAPMIWPLVDQESFGSIGLGAGVAAFGGTK
jgi:hypothetical protein